MNLLKKRGLLAIFSLALLFSNNLKAEKEEVKKVTPYAFYQGTELDLLGSTSAFFWLELPAKAYLNSAYPQTLQDVRVFNGTGDEVPTALFYDAEKSVSTANVSFVPQRLITQVDTVNSKDEERWEKQYLLVEAIPGKVSRIELPKMQNKSEAAYQAYLLTRNEAEDKNAVIQSLNLDWVKKENDWQAKVFIYASSDKENWLNIAANQPVMNLRLDSGTIASNTIELLKGNVRVLNSPYLLVITVSSPDVIVPDLQRVNATSTVSSSTRRQQSFHFEMTNDGISRDQVIYQLPSIQPISELKIKLQQANRVIPLKMEYLSDRGESWKPLANIVAYNQTINGENTSNPNLMLNGEMIRTLRITALKGSWEDLPPHIEGMRDAINLIFNMQGATPYILVWGNRQASLEKLTYNQLIDQPYSVEEVMVRYPELYVTDEVIELGGEDMLTETSLVDEDYHWMTIILWVLLLVGIFALLYFCWYLLKEVNSPNKNNTDEL